MMIFIVLIALACLAYMQWEISGLMELTRGIIEEQRKVNGDIGGRLSALEEHAGVTRQ